MIELIGRERGTAPCVATIGTFDGVHRGHRFVIEQVTRLARQRELMPLVVTFPSHPALVLHPERKQQLLTLADEKAALLQEAGAEQVAMLPFTPQLALLSAREFMRSVLQEQLGVKVLMVGYDNRLGHGREGFDDCRRHGEELGIEVVGCDELPSVSGISSTAARKALTEGHVEEANRILGYPYFLQGQVVEGFQNGRTLGYPTANLQVDANKLVPENGAYLVRTPLAYGMLNIGTRPTLHNGPRRSIEVHLFDFDGNLYGHTLRVELLEHLRKECEFASLDELRQQLAKDEADCRKRIGQ